MWQKQRLSSNLFSSAVSQHLKDCCKNHIIQCSCHFYIKQQNGMHLQNFGYIQRVLSSILNSLQQSLGKEHKSLGIPPSLLLQRLNFQKKQGPKWGVKSLPRGRRMQWQVMHLGKNPKPWTSSCTNGMHLGITFMLSVFLVEQMDSQPKLSVIFFPCIFDLFTIFCWQGKISHKIVKHLYGLTNKHDATCQIAKCYWRLEHAHLAGDRNWLCNYIKQKTTGLEDNGLDGDLELRYFISSSKNYPEDIIGTVHKNRDDPAYYVCFSD